MENLSQRIATASQEGLMEIIYEALIKRCDEGIEFLKNEDYKQAARIADKIRDITAHLNATLPLDMDEETLRVKRIYLYMNQIGNLAVIKRDPKYLQELKQIAIPIYEGWKEVAENEFKHSMSIKAEKPSIRAGMTYGKNNINEYVVSSRDWDKG